MVEAGKYPAATDENCNLPFVRETEDPLSCKQMSALYPAMTRNPAT